MDIFLGLLVFLAGLALLIISTFLDLAFLKWIKKGSHMFLTKTFITLLLGFSVFVVVTPKIELLGQKIFVIIAVTILILVLMYRVKENE